MSINIFCLLYGVTIVPHAGPLSVYIDRLKQVYRAPPPTWDPLPQCGHIKLAMIREKGKRRGGADETMVRHQVKGEVEAIVDSRVPIEVDRIFDSGLFDEERQVILVEGPPGGGKTSLTYHYGQEWAAGNLNMFDVVAVVHLRELAVTQASTLPDLLLLACVSGNDEEITRDMMRLYVMKCPRLLLVLDGWDEAPNQLRKPSLVTEIFQSIMPLSKILITSRPESSVDLHGLANRVEIVGFTKESIYDYFQRALSTELDHVRVEDGCRKLKEHFRNHPVIQSCCSIPLNAAILAHLFLTELSLPSTRHELFLMLVLSRINRELQERYSHGNVTVLSLDNLPDTHKIVLRHIRVLAFEGVKQNKVVFPQEELVRLNIPLDLPGLGVLQNVHSFGKLGKTAYRYFIHLSIQELLAAYHISQLEEDEQVKVFEDLLDEPRFSSVLQFYAAFTRLTNQGVQNIILRRNYSNELTSKLTLLTFLRCFFEAQIQDPLLYQQLVFRLNRNVYLVAVALSPFDCMSVGYFLAFALMAGRLSVTLDTCSINNHSFGLLLGELSRHAEACPAGVLQGVTRLSLGCNKIGDKGIAHIANSLRTNTTISDLDVSFCDISDIGLQSLAEAIAANVSVKLKTLDIGFINIGDIGTAHIATVLQVNTTIKLIVMRDCAMLDKGAESLARALAVNRSLEYFDLTGTNISDTGAARIATALRVNNSLVWLEVGGDTTTDAAVLSLVDALKKNTSLEVINLRWSTTHPDYTLKSMGDIFKVSNLRMIFLDMRMLHNAPAVNTEEEVVVWLQLIKAGGKELILSLEDNGHLRSLSLHIKVIKEYASRSSLSALRLEIRTSLEAAVASVNSVRNEESYCALKFFCTYNS